LKNNTNANYYICRRCGEQIDIKFFHCPKCGIKKRVDHYLFDEKLIKSDFKYLKAFCRKYDLSYAFVRTIISGAKNLTKNSETFKKTPKKYIKLKPKTP
jgi:hypothetical protein